MKLEEVIKGINIIEIIGHVAKKISGIHIDSRKIEEDHLFVAVKGTQTDGHAYITKAIEKEHQSFPTLQKTKLHILR